MDQPAASFDIASSARTLTAACLRANLDPDGARLLRHHTNAVYQLTGRPVIVKISRSGANPRRIAHAVVLARRLTEAGVPVVSPWPGVEQPITVDGRHVTFWTAIRFMRPPRTRDLAIPLRLLHDVAAPADLGLPTLDPFTAISRSLTSPNILTGDELEFLASRSKRLRADYALVRFADDPVVIHGDAHHSNTLIGPAGAVLADLESACVGPAEWDLVTVAVHCRRFGRPAEEYREFAAAYGRDIEDWSGCRTLTAVRELRMITTNAWKSVPGSAAAAEVHQRIYALRVGDDDRLWQLL